MVRSDGTVSVSVGVVCTKDEEKKASERVVSPVCESQPVFESVYSNIHFTQCIFFFQTVNCSRAFYTVKELLDSETQ